MIKAMIIKTTPGFIIDLRYWLLIPTIWIHSNLNYP